jgi:hypothetical protein
MGETLQDKDWNEFGGLSWKIIGKRVRERWEAED